MKYSEKNKPLVCMMTQSSCYKGTRKFTPKGVLWHSTGANNPNVKRYVQPDDNAADRDAWLKKLGKNTNHNDWNHTAVQAGLNFWIGKLADGTVAAVQTMPWDYRPWGCGSGSKGSGNDIYIQFEICEDGLNDASYFNACYKEACEMTAYLCKMYGIDPKGTIDYKGLKVPTIIDHTGSHSLGIGSNHGDIQHWSRKYGKTMDNVRNDVAALLSASVSSSSGAVEIQNTLKASDIKGLSQADVIKKVASYFTADQKKSGILASVSFAQFILESGYGQSELAQNANNCFGMKTSLSGNTWSGSTWDGKSKYTKKTQEQKADGSYVTVTADFRAYDNIADSIADHSAYLNGAMNGKKLRYAGLKGCKDYRKALQIIKDGGYATSKDYVENLCKVVETWNLTQYDVKEAVSSGSSGSSIGVAVSYYRVRKSWKDKDSQIGAFTVLDNAKACVDQNPGYKAYDEDGQQVYPTASSAFPYTVKIIATDLNYRKGPGTSYKSWGHIKPGVYTIVDEQDGWGLLKSYQKERNGWVKLSYTKRV